MGAIERKFHGELIGTLGLSVDLAADQMAVKRWPETARRFAAVFVSRSPDDWLA